MQLYHIYKDSYASELFFDIRNKESRALNLIGEKIFKKLENNFLVMSFYKYSTIKSNLKLHTIQYYEECRNNIYDITYLIYGIFWQTYGQ